MLCAGLLFLLMDVSLANYSNLHEIMTEEELNYYFGTTDLSDIQDTYDVGLLRKVEDDNILTRLLKAEGNEDFMYVFEAFGKEVSLKMRKNNLLVSPRANIAHIDPNGTSVRRNVNHSKVNCHLVHQTGSLVAAVSNCNDGNMMGFISTDKDTFEIAPLTERLKQIAEPNYFRRRGGMPEISAGMLINDLYLVKRAIFPNFIEDEEDNKEIDVDSWYPDLVQVLDVEEYEFPIESDDQATDTENQNKIIEMAVFLDLAGYNRLSQLYSDEEIESVVLAYINQVAALYHIPSLGQQIDITITYLEIMKYQNFDSHEGRREKLLQSFCDYSNGLNPEDDLSDPRHWDIGILVTGLDLWQEKNGVRNDDTLGVARTRGMCHYKFSCAVVELGVVGAIGTLYPTTGFSAAYILAHELGHTLGMNHDGWEDNCDWSGYIMSSSRGKHGQTHWSECSKAKLFNYDQTGRLKCLRDRPSQAALWDHNKTHGVPGYFITAEEQCRFFYRGAEGARAVEQDTEICSSLRCSDGRTEEETGPPLEGTSCGVRGGEAHWCKEGDCVPVQPARWQEWRGGQCQSACVKHGTGVRRYSRSCLLLPGYETGHQCPGIDQYLSLCDDVAICGTRSCGSARRTRVDIATERCGQLRPLQANDSYVMGSPAKHHYEKPEQACAIYCNRSPSQGWYRARDTFFPDGTWCHHDQVLGDFFCRDNKCQPRNATFF